MARKMLPKEEYTFQEIGDKLGISAEYARLCYKSGMEKLAKLLEDVDLYE